MTNDEIVALEALIDRYGLSAVLATIAQTCHLKSDHVRENWQDPGLTTLWEPALATLWERAAIVVEAASINTQEVP